MIQGSKEKHREVRSMKNNVFLKSTLRQPVKTALLALVTALMTFRVSRQGPGAGPPDW